MRESGGAIGNWDLRFGEGGKNKNGGMGGENLNGERLTESESI